MSIKNKITDMINLYLYNIGCMEYHYTYSSFTNTFRVWFFGNNIEDNDIGFSEILNTLPIELQLEIKSIMLGSMNP